MLNKSNTKRIFNFYIKCICAFSILRIMALNLKNSNIKIYTIYLFIYICISTF